MYHSSRRRHARRGARLLTEFLYDLLQRAVGAQVICNRLAPHLTASSGQRVLDVGAGTGIYAAALPAGAQHIWLDRDSGKLGRFRAKFPHYRRALLSDATAIGLADAAVDAAICMNVMHHLPDDAAQGFLREISRVTRRRIVIEDPLLTSRMASRALWSIDRGSYPRSRARLLELVSSALHVDHVEEFTVWHRYLLMVCVSNHR